MKRGAMFGIVLALVLSAACGGGGKTAGTTAQGAGSGASQTGVVPQVAQSGKTLAGPGAPVPTRGRAGGAAARPAGGTSSGTLKPVPVSPGGQRPASEDRTGVTKATMKVGYHWPKSSYYGAILKSYIEHFQLYFTGKTGVNDRGGIGGRTIELIEADDQFSPSGAAAAAKQLEEAKAFLVYGHIGVEQEIVALSHFEKKGIPYIANGLMTKHVRASKIGFTFLTPWDLIAETVPSFIDHRLGAKGKKIGLIWEQPDWPIPKDAFLVEAKREGLNIVVVEPVTATQASYVPNVQRVQNAGAQVVVLLGRLSVPGILRDARAIDFRPTWTGFGPWTLNLFNTASGNLMEGFKAVRQWQGVDSPKYQEYVRFLAANGREDEASEEGFGGWMIGFFLEHLIARAGPDPTRESFVEGLEKTDVNPVILKVTPPVEYAPGRHWQSDKGLPVQVKSGNWVAIGDWSRRF